MPRESEKDTEQYLVKETTKRNGQSYKWVSPGVRGVPDRICIFPSYTIFVEIKSEGETLDPLQIILHRKLHLVTPHVYTVTTKKDVDILFQLLFKEALCI